MTARGAWALGGARRWGVAVAALTLAAFALRVAGIDQSLFGDELFTFAW